MWDQSIRLNPSLVLKKYFPCLLDHFSTSLFDKKNIQQREISDSLSSVSSEQLEGRTREVSFNSCLVYYIIAQTFNCKICKLQDCKDGFQICSLQNFLFILSKG